MAAVSGADGLNIIESLLQEVGGPSKAGANSTTSKTFSKRNMSSPIPGGTDCLAKDGNSQFLSPQLAKRSPSSNSSMRGAFICGKDVGSSRYLGKGFSQPPQDNPGPIYEPTRFQANVSCSVSIARAQRLVGVNSDTPGPNIALPGSIGKQVSSVTPSAATCTFPKGQRFNPKEFISRMHSKGTLPPDSPSPTAYQSMDSSNAGRSAILIGKLTTNKLYISRAHIADCIGLNSPGPIYDAEDAVRERMRELKQRPPAFLSLTSKTSCGPSYSFGGATTKSIDDDEVPVEVTNPKDACSYTIDDKGAYRRCCVRESAKPNGVSKHIPQTPFISHEHSKVQNCTETPGPAFYHVDTTCVLRQGPNVGFTKDTGKRTLSMVTPGPKYHPLFSSVQPVRSAIAFGSPLAHETVGGRANKLYLGKGMDQSQGWHSPGPIYPAAEVDHGPSYSIVSKERKKSKNIKSGPEYPRYISYELLRENQGAFSPGPKYDVAPGFDVMNRRSPSATFATKQFSADDVAANRLAQTRSSRPKKKPVVVVLDPSCLSTFKSGPSIQISPPPPQRVQRPTGEAPVLHQPPPQDFLKRGVSIGHAERLSSLKPTTKTPGPGNYSPNYVQVDKWTGATSLGELSAERRIITK